MELVEIFNCKMFSFLWNNKVGRDVISQPRCVGGIKMLNLEMYIKGLKLTWISRIPKSGSKSLCYRHF